MSYQGLGRAYSNGQRHIRALNALDAQIARQGELPLRRSFRPVLVDVNRAMECLSYGIEVVNQLVDTGELKWVFDVGSGAGRRELRFWLGELLLPEAQREKPLTEVLNAIAGHSTMSELRASTVGDILLLRRPSVWRFVVTGELNGRQAGHVQWINRAALVSFLGRRWIGHAR
jgi:hypothetical protein